MYKKEIPTEETDHHWPMMDKLCTCTSMTPSCQSFHNLRWIHGTQNLFHEVSMVGWFKE